MGKIKNGKYISLKNDKVESYITIKSEAIVQFIEKNRANYKVIYPAIINFLRDAKPQDKLDRDDLEDFILLAQADVAPNQQISPDQENELLQHLENTYLRTDFKAFRGVLLEFFTMQIENGNAFKMYHEPRIYYKKERILNSNHFGHNSLVDIVKIKKDRSYICLTECKANLNWQIKDLKKGKNKNLKKKLKYMDTIEMKISKCVINSCGFVEVEKVLTSVETPVVKLPSEYKGYKVIGLLEYYRTKNPHLENKFIS